MLLSSALETGACAGPCWSRTPSTPSRSHLPWGCRPSARQAARPTPCRESSPTCERSRYLGALGLAGTGHLAAHGRRAEQPTAQRVAQHEAAAAVVLSVGGKRREMRSLAPTCSELKTIVARFRYDVGFALSRISQQGDKKLARRKESRFSTWALGEACGRPSLEVSRYTKRPTGVQLGAPRSHLTDG